MIHVDRGTVRVPEFFASKRADELRGRVAEYYERSRSLRKQSRARIDLRYLREGEVKSALFELFAGKCAYCEQKLTMEDAEVDQFRPKVLYPYLAYEWDNQYLACAVCNRNKGARFPVLDESLRDVGPGADLSGEGALLIDPCADRPQLDLAFPSGGRVEARREGDRGPATIKVLGLNRVELIEMRHDAAARTERLLESHARPGRDEPRDVEALLSPCRREAPFAAVGRALLEHWLEDYEPRAPLERELRDRVESYARTLWEWAPGEAARAEAGPEASRGGVGGARPERERDADPGRGEPVEQSSTGYQPSDVPVSNAAIQSIKITRFKAIDALELHPCTAPEEVVLETEEDQASIPSLRGWMTLLGENGSGKSSVLQAVALALAGERILQDGTLVPRRFLKRGAKWGRVALELSTGEEISLRITKTRFRFEKGGGEHGTFVRAYGSTRLPPSSSDAGAPPRVPQRLEYANMFHAFTPLIDADAWLAGLGEDTDEMTAAQRALRDLLDLDEDWHIVIDGGHVFLDGEPLENLSSGYQTLIALACDIMAGLGSSGAEGLSDMQQAQGIVLIDEIGTHLHPSWKMRIVSRLRKTFPLIQFLISTHEPLCLRGHSRGEVLLVKREVDPDDEPAPGEVARRVVTVDADLPSPSRLRVDQLLTSSHFGLNSTIDPRVDRMFEEYYQLLARKNELDAAQKERCVDLSRLLQGHGILGYTRRDQLVYEAIDEYLAQGVSDPARERKVKKRVQDLWSYAKAFDAEGEA